MQSTLVVLVSDGRKAIWGHVGDSRLYCFRNGNIIDRTLDHSVSQMKVDKDLLPPEDLRSDKEGLSRILQAAGRDGPFSPTVLPQPIDLYQNDSFLLCVDGFWGPVYETEMEIDWAKSACAQEWVDHMRRRIENRLRADSDNYTAFAIIVCDPCLPAAEPTRVLRADEAWQLTNPDGSGESSLIPADQVPDTPSPRERLGSRRISRINSKVDGNMKVRARFSSRHLFATGMASFLLGIGLTVLAAFAFPKLEKLVRAGIKPKPQEVRTPCTGLKWSAVEMTAGEGVDKGVLGTLFMNAERRISFTIDAATIPRIRLADFNVKIISDFGGDKLILKPNARAGNAYTAAQSYRLREQSHFSKSQRACLEGTPSRPSSPAQTPCQTPSEWPATRETVIVGEPTVPGSLILNSDRSLTFTPSSLEQHVELTKLNVRISQDNGGDKLVLIEQNSQHNDQVLRGKRFTLVRPVHFSKQERACLEGKAP